MNKKFKIQEDFPMRKFIRPLTALCCFTMLFSSLCACSGETEKIVPESTSKHEISEQQEVPKTEAEPSVSISPANTNDTADNESESGITITGKRLSDDQLVSFEPDYEWARTYTDNWYVNDFLNSLEDPVFKDLYCKALTLIRLVSTDNLTPADAVLAQGDERAQLKLDGEGGLYLESGYTVDSFREAYYSVFTKETADIILSAHSAFYSYDRELWYKSISAGGNAGEIFQEYELINQTDTELEFKRISYSVAIGEPITDYDPAKKEEYEKSEVEFRFVKTEDGWRAEKFLNATVKDQPMLIA